MVSWYFAGRGGVSGCLSRCLWLYLMWCGVGGYDDLVGVIHLI